MSYELRQATEADLDGARGVMLDTFYREFSYGYQPQWHADAIDPRAAYLAPPRHALFVAVLGDEVVATTGVRAQAPKSPPHPEWIARRYPPETTAQLFRVYVRPEHRRFGLARSLVHLATEFVAATPGYERLYLHTDARVPGVDKFWGSLAVEILDARDGDPDHFQTIHYEIPLS
ncbi:GNAT family N-acetyltransferase [Actinokineospora sp. HUAS TT18]|uniref:GNAT family N-acetyltransferase n=1 Tax=Actinokineospora sp. HUAS TT18 TaxID=3447451 RepID=UPI003F526411